MNELRNTTELVWEILVTVPETRNSDNLLYIEVLRHYSEKLGIDVAGYPFASVLKNLNEWGIPTIETVGRCRRKLQHDNPELAASGKVRCQRAERRAEFIDYARGDV